MKSELKPCPFCGGEAKIRQSHPSQAKHNKHCAYWQVTCDPVVEGYVSSCPGSQSDTWQATPEDAELEWNTRASCWIPVSERLPRQQRVSGLSDVCIVAYRNEYGEVFVWPAQYDVHAKYWEGMGNTVDCDKSRLTVTHWMPLPEPPQVE